MNKKATFAGGCFWCIEAAFEELDGVESAISGYTGGDLNNPTYHNHGTHKEAVQITFDPEKISYKKLLEIFWTHIDPTDEGGQFVDRGSSYTTAIYYHDEEQKKLAEESKAAIKLDEPIFTEILPAQEFYEAEKEHQNYYKTCSLQYNAYKLGSGRAQKLKELWG
ncbi:peptide-methionine (S)-S-oxide reductase MsrA [Patescibacteria group bacterium]